MHWNAGTNASIVATSTLSAVTSTGGAAGGHSNGHKAAIAVPIVLVMAVAACKPCPDSEAICSSISLCLWHLVDNASIHHGLELFAIHPLLIRTARSIFQ